MRGQSSVEMLVLVAGILIFVAGMFFTGSWSNEPAVATRAARDGAENAIAAIGVEYGCSIDISDIGFRNGTITIYVAVRDAPPEGFSWESFSEQILEPSIREEALRHIHNALHGTLPATPAPVGGSYYTYDVEVEATRVIK
jgi:hypothetical protein